MENNIKLLCIKDFYMADGVTRRFTEGKTYDAEIFSNGGVKAINDGGYPHSLNIEYVLNYFKKVDSENNLPDNVIKLLEQEKKYLEGHIQDIEKSLESYRSIVTEKEANLAKNKSDLENIIKVLEG
jgi:hypothetical protein